MFFYEILLDNFFMFVDDGVCVYLEGMFLLDLDLLIIGGGLVNLFKLLCKMVVYCYFMIGVSGVVLFDGWDEISGVWGCML